VQRDLYLGRSLESLATKMVRGLHTCETANGACETVEMGYGTWGSQRIDEYILIYSYTKSLY
jgi:hypothetical protein